MSQLEPASTTEVLATTCARLVVAMGAFVAAVLWFVSETGWVGAVIPAAWSVGAIWARDSRRLLACGQGSAAGLVLAAASSLLLPMVTYRILDHLV